MTIGHKGMLLVGGIIAVLSVMVLLLPDAPTTTPLIVSPLVESAETVRVTKPVSSPAVAIIESTAPVAKSSPLPTVAGITTQLSPTKSATESTKDSVKASPAPKKPAPNCSANVYNCGDFSSCAEAMAVYNACPNDPHGLDGNDNDGIPCESLCD